MSSQPLNKELDATPLVNTILEKTKAGKLKWEATAIGDVFIASLGGNTTLKIKLVTYEGEDYDQPELCLLDDKGKTDWEISNSQVKGGLWPLFNLARRIGNKVDEKMETLMEVLQKL